MSAIGGKLTVLKNFPDSSAPPALLACAFSFATTVREVAVRDGSLEDGFGNVLDTFEALVENLDHLIAFHTGDGSPPEVVSHIENAKALAGE
jgi:hypothetical protein